MKTAGSLLKEAREASNISLSDIAKKTRIREEYLAAIERDDYSQLPSGPFVRGFLRTFASEVGVNGDTVVATYRRDFGAQKDEGIIPKGLLNPIRRKMRFMVNPLLFGISIVALVVFVFVAYQWISFVKPPQLRVLDPVENLQTNSSVLVRGQTTSDAIVTVNQNPVATDQDGNFTTQLELAKGDQIVIVEAATRNGKSSVVRRMISVK